MKILGFIADPGGVGHYRVLFPFRELRVQGGHEAALAPHERMDGPDDSMFVNFADPVRTIAYVQPDLLVIQRPVHPVWRAVLDHAKCPVVVELDDWYFNLSPSNPAAQARGKDSYRVLRDCVAKADCVTVPTSYLADLHYRWTQRVEVLPNLLDWTMWDQVRPNYERARENGHVRVGWMGAPQYGREGDASLLDVFDAEFLRSHPEVRLVHAGPGEMWALPGLADRVIHLPEVKFPRNGPPRLIDFDIGLVPLADTRFNRAKSTLKGLEYMAAGVPFVASRLPEYVDLASRSGVGYTARRPRDWVRHVEGLLDPQLRLAQGIRARAYARTRTIQEHWRLWEDVYADVVERGRVRSAA